MKIHIDKFMNETAILLADMAVRGAARDEIERVIKYSMYFMKCASAFDMYDIEKLADKYQRPED